MCLPVTPYKIEREWEHAGLKCAVVQAREAGNRCGYVRVPPGHHLHGKDYDAPDVDVHGGLTFASLEPCEHEDGTGWWFGFDCAHAGDAYHDPAPQMDQLSEDGRRRVEVFRKIHMDVLLSMYPQLPGEADGDYVSRLSQYDHHRFDHFWTQAEVEKETERLAEQLAAL